MRDMYLRKKAKFYYSYNLIFQYLIFDAEKTLEIQHLNMFFTLLCLDKFDDNFNDNLNDNLNVRKIEYQQSKPGF